MQTAKRLLLIDVDDSRRETRVQLLKNSGYDVDVRQDYVAAEKLGDEGSYDLVIVALHRQPELTATYSDHLTKNKPSLPILLLTDLGVFVPKGTLSHSVESGSPAELIQEVAAMLAGSTHIKETPVMASK